MDVRCDLDGTHVFVDGDIFTEDYSRNAINGAGSRFSPTHTHENRGTPCA